MESVPAAQDEGSSENSNPSFGATLGTLAKVLPRFQAGNRGPQWKEHPEGPRVLEGQTHLTCSWALGRAPLLQRTEGTTWSGWTCWPAGVET